MARHSPNGRRFNRFAVSLGLLASAILAVVAYATAQSASNISLYMSVFFIFASASVYFAFLLIIDAAGGVDPHSEGQVAYIAVIGIGVVLFAALSQLNMETNTAAIFDVAVIMALSVAARFASGLKWTRKRSSLSSLLRLCSWVAIIFVALVGFYILAVTYVQSQPSQVPVINAYELVPSGACSLLNESSNTSIIMCSDGEAYTGFKLLGVNRSSAQILIYDDCGACAHTQTNANQFVEIINVSIGGEFGGACQGVYPSELIATNVYNYTAVFELNESGRQMFCI